MGTFKMTTSPSAIKAGGQTVFPFANASARLAMGGHLMQPCVLSTDNH
jgi:hypothetical protein